MRGGRGGVRKGETKWVSTGEEGRWVRWRRIRSRGRERGGKGTKRRGMGGKEGVGGERGGKEVRGEGEKNKSRIEGGKGGKLERRGRGEGIKEGGENHCLGKDKREEHKGTRNLRQIEKKNCWSP